MTTKGILTLFFLGSVTIVNATELGENIINSDGKSSSVTQTGSGAKCFDENTRIINLGIGFGGGNYYKEGRGGSYTYGRTPAFSLSYEQALKQKAGPGFIGVGAYFGYQNAHYRYDDLYYGGSRYYYQHNWNYFMIAARGAYHWDVLNSAKAEVYAGAILGVRIQTYSYTTNDPSPYKDSHKLNEGSAYAAFSLFAGARWYFAPKVAVFGEIGYGISVLTAGLSFKI